MRFNSWQRLWAVGSVVSLVSFGLVLPAWLTLRSDSSDWSYRMAIEYDFLNSDCSRYIFGDFEALQEPPFDHSRGKCWHLYTARKYDRERYGDKVPYTMPIYLQNKSAYKRGRFLEAAAFGSVASLGLSALVYGIGAVVAWIIRGSRGR